MNVKQWLAAPVTTDFQARDLRKHESYRGGFETDITIFGADVKADWRCRDFAVTARRYSRSRSRRRSVLDPGSGENEIRKEIDKIAVHRDEIATSAAICIPS